MLNQITPILIRIVVQGIQIGCLKNAKRGGALCLHACFCTGGFVHFSVEGMQECRSAAQEWRVAAVAMDTAAL